MAEIKEFQPSTPPFQERAGQAKERPKPAAPLERASLNENEREKPARVIGRIEPARKQIYEISIDANSVLADALDLIQAGQMTDEEIDALLSISENEKILLKISACLFKDLKDKDEVIATLRDLIKRLKQRLGEE